MWDNEWWGKRELVCEFGEGELSAVSRSLSCRGRGGIIRGYIGAVEKVDTLRARRWSESGAVRRRRIGLHQGLFSVKGQADHLTIQKVDD